ncbi:hypothetical protein B566_EDAN011809 [Ephemera danica]|nr:hypothetical protein B566_EDAN011809 [Ephemera danica]
MGFMKLWKVQQLRFFSIQSCNFARGSRLIGTPPFEHKATEDTTARATSNQPTTAQQQYDDEIVSKIINLNEDDVRTAVPKKLNISDYKLKEYQQNSVTSLATSPFYEKLKDSDNRFSTLMTMLRSKKDRERKKQIVLEGRRLIQDALDAGIKTHSIFFSNKDSLKELHIPKHTSKFRIFESPPEPELNTLSSKNHLQLPLTLVCDNVREPGNLGAILRIAAGVGCKQVLLTKGCVDLWEPKVLRSAAGAHFRVPVIRHADWGDLEELVKQERASVYLADSRGDLDTRVLTHDYCETKFDTEEPLVLVLGGETEGLSTSAQQLSNCRHLHIPLAGGVESLNVAAALAVLVFEMRRQRLQATRQAARERVRE